MTTSPSTHAGRADGPSARLTASRRRRLGGALLCSLMLTGLTGLSGAAQAAGRAEVSYSDPQRFADAGFGAREIEHTQQTLTAHFERLARRLPDGQVLHVTVRDIDLAGELDMFFFDRVRVLGRVPDSPRLSLSFELRADGQVLRAGDDELRDIGYLHRLPWVGQGDALAHERRLLDSWFSQKVVAGSAAVR